MKIKHWAGYGTVNAKKVADFHHYRYMRKYHVVQVIVTGDHERGLCRYDNYDIHNWIGKRFVKDKNYTDLVDYDVQHGWDADDTEIAIYTLEYKED